MFTIQMVQTPESLPDWYPPFDKNNLGYYSFRIQVMDMMSVVMIRAGAVTEIAGAASDEATDNNSLVPVDKFRSNDGLLVEPRECLIIAHALRLLATNELEESLIEELRVRWDALQERLEQEVRSKGEIPVSGFEKFPYAPSELRNDIFHWGAYNLIASDYGGYRIT